MPLLVEFTTIPLREGAVLQLEDAILDWTPYSVAFDGEEDEPRQGRIVLHPCAAGDPFARRFLAWLRARPQVLPATIASRDVPLEDVMARDDA